MVNDMATKSKNAKTESSAGRPDGRKNDEPRKLMVKAGVIPRADGSAYVEFGKTHAIAAVYGPKPVIPKHQENPHKAILRCRYAMMPFSVKDRKRPGYDRRSTEIAMVAQSALEPAIFLEEFPRTAIDVEMQIIQADAGTRVAAITAAAVALADAGIPMRDLVSAVAAGRANGNVLLDLTKEEEDAEDAVDMPMAMMPRLGKITLLQMDGDVPLETVEEIVKTGTSGCMKVYEAQKDALKKKYEMK